MANLLIHSMAEFGDIILGALALAEAREIVEIGAEYGGMSKLLADHAERAGGMLVSIDPAPHHDFTSWAATVPHVHHVPMPSLDAIDKLVAADAWVVDGDHNWYTVYHELQAIHRLSRRDGRPMLAILHDIGWPSGRRDQYYAPDRIPQDYRHPYSYEGGATLDQSPLTPHRGFRGVGAFAFAQHEGGPRNGVLTAVEDFLAFAGAEDREMGFAEIPGVFGLGVVFDLDASWSAQLAEQLIPYHQNSLLRTLERNRLINYLHVIQMQDELATIVPFPAQQAMPGKALEYRAQKKSRSCRA